MIVETSFPDVQLLYEGNNFIAILTKDGQIPYSQEIRRQANSYIDKRLNPYLENFRISEKLWQAAFPDAWREMKKEIVEVPFHIEKVPRLIVEDKDLAILYSTEYSLEDDKELIRKYLIEYALPMLKYKKSCNLPYEWDTNPMTSEEASQQGFICKRQSVSIGKKIPENFNRLFPTSINGKRINSIARPNPVFGNSNVSIGSIKLIEIPASICAIQGHAFCNFQGLEDVRIDEGLINIGGGAFCRCNSLRSITFPKTVTSLGCEVLASCSMLETVCIEGPIDAIRDNSFQGDRKLKNINIPDTVSEIGDYAFAHCSSLQEMVLPSGLKTIGKEAFSNCSIKDLVIPDSVEAIGFNAFKGIEHIEYHGKAIDFTSSDWGARFVN